MVGESSCRGMRLQVCCRCPRRHRLRRLYWGRADLGMWDRFWVAGPVVWTVQVLKGKVVRWIEVGSVHMYVCRLLDVVFYYQYTKIMHLTYQCPFSELCMGRRPWRRWSFLRASLPRS